MIVFLLLLELPLIFFHLWLKSGNHQHILTYLVGLTAFVLAIVVYWYIFNFFTEFSKIMFKIDCEKWSTYSISLWWSYISLEWFCVCSLNFDFSIFVSLSSTLRILISSSSRNFSVISISLSLKMVTNALDMSTYWVYF